MSAPELFFYILFAIVVQVATFSTIALLRQRRAYDTLVKKQALSTNGSSSGPGKNNKPAWQDWRDFRVERRLYESPDKSICSFYLKPVDEGSIPSFKPGQYLTFQLPVGDTPLIRCYSLSDGPGKNTYRVSIKRVPAPADKSGVPPGRASNFFHDAIEEGDHLLVKPPGGHFFLNDGDDPVVLIAGGIGITPMLSMLDWIFQNRPEREVSLYYGVRNSGDHALKGTLKTLAQKHPNFRLHICYSRPLPEDEEERDFQHKGRVTVDLIRQTLPFKIHDFFICGPGAMLESIVPALEDWGIDDHRIHYEAFGPSSLKKPKHGKAKTTNETVNVTFLNSGETLTWTGEQDNLLEFAEDNGIEVASGCRAGSCGGCQTPLNEGAVDYDREPDFDVEKGSCLLCISRPKKDLVLEA